MTAYMEHRDLTNETIAPARAQEISGNVRRVLDRLATAEVASGREPGSVRMLAATKTRDVGEIMAAIDAGVHMIGENRPQEVQVKMPVLARLATARGFSLGMGESSESELAQESTHIPFHLIGQLQSNKIGKVLSAVDCIESVDTIELAEKIARRAVARGVTVGVMLEVNESGEESKSGCPPSHAIDFAQRIGNMGGLRLQGLMTIGAHVRDETVIRAGFAHLRKVRDQILAEASLGTEHCTELSMGMTQDMELAVREGATIVRVGTAIFGSRAFR